MKQTNLKKSMTNFYQIPEKEHSSTLRIKKTHPKDTKEVIEEFTPEKCKK